MKTSSTNRNTSQCWISSSACPSKVTAGTICRCFFFCLGGVRIGNIYNNKMKKNLDNSVVLPYDITLSMLAYLLLSKVATLTQSYSLSAIFLYVHLCLTTCQEHWFSIHCHYSLCLRCLNGITSCLLSQ